MTHTQLIQILSCLGITDAVADSKALVNGRPAILLRKDGREEYYTGYGSKENELPDIHQTLIKQFGD